MLLAYSRFLVIYMFKEERDFFFYEGIDDPWKLPLFSVCFFPANKFRDIAERMARSHQTVNKGEMFFYFFTFTIIDSIDWLKGEDSKKIQG